MSQVKKAMLEASMLTLQEGNQLLEQLRQLALRGTIDSRPNQIRTTVQSGEATSVNSSMMFDRLGTEFTWPNLIADDICSVK